MGYDVQSTDTRAGLCPSTVRTHRPGERCQRCSGSRLRVLNLGARRSLRTPPSAPLLPPKTQREWSREEPKRLLRASPITPTPSIPSTDAAERPAPEIPPNPPPAPGTAPTLSQPPPGSPSLHHGRSAPSGAPKPRGTPQAAPTAPEPIRPHRHFGLPQPLGPGLGCPRRRARSPSRPGPEGAALSSSGWAFAALTRCCGRGNRRLRALRAGETLRPRSPQPGAPPFRAGVAHLPSSPPPAGRSRPSPSAQLLPAVARPPRALLLARATPRPAPIGRRSRQSAHR